MPRIAFTGGVPSGRAVATAAARHLKSVTLELSGKNPLIVFPDVDVPSVAATAVRAMNFTRGQAQSCGSPSRMLVHESIRARFVAELVARVEALTIGDPLEPGVAMGPLAFAAHYERVLGYVERGHADGARLVTGGGRPPGVGAARFFVAQTVFDDVTRDMTPRVPRSRPASPPFRYAEFPVRGAGGGDGRGANRELAGPEWGTRGSRVGDSRGVEVGA